MMWYNLKVTVKQRVEIMQIMIEIPDHLANQLQLQPNQISQKSHSSKSQRAIAPKYPMIKSRKLKIIHQ